MRKFAAWAEAMYWGFYVAWRGRTFTLRYGNSAEYAGTYNRPTYCTLSISGTVGSWVVQGSVVPCVVGNGFAAR